MLDRSLPHITLYEKAFIRPGGYVHYGSVKRIEWDLLRLGIGSIILQVKSAVWKRFDPVKMINEHLSRPRTFETGRGNLVYLTAGKVL